MRPYIRALFAVCQLLLVAVCPLPCTRAMAQQYRFFASDAMSSSLVTSMVQDAAGYMWVGTEHGLNRFDGYRFTSATLPQPRHQSITTLFSDTQSRLWAGTSHGLLLHDSATDTFQEVVFPGDLAPRVTSLVQTSDGRLLAGTAGYGLFMVSADSLFAAPVEQADTAADRNFITCLRTDAAGHLWKGTPSGNATCLRTDGSVATVLPPYGAPQTFATVDGEMLAVCQQGIFSLMAHECLEPSVPFTCAATDSDGNLYLGTRGQGLYWLPAGQRTAERYYLQVRDFALSRARIQALYIDRQGNLWVGCQQKGVLLIPLYHRPVFQTWSFSAQRQETGTGVSAITKTDDGTVWCAVQGDGIYAFAPDGKLQAHPTAPAGVETLYRDAEGRFFVGTQQGLYAYNPATGTSTLFAATKGEHVNLVKALPHGLLAVSTFGTGFSILDLTTGQVVRRHSFHEAGESPHGRLCNDWILTMDTDSRGRLWIGTASGISCYDPDADSFQSEGWDILLDMQACTALHVVAGDEVIIASEAALVRYAGGHLAPLHFPTTNKAGIAPAVSYLTSNDDGSLWIATSDGLFHCAAGDSVLSAPLVNDEFIHGAGYQCTDGRILLGTADGVLTFDPAQLQSLQTTDAQVHLTAFVLAGQTVRPEHPDHFRIRYTDNNFQLHFSLLDYARGDDVTFEYQLRGDEGWTQVPQNIVSFNHLAAGTYELRVRAVVDGTHSPVTTYTLEILPPWWRSTWAYLIYILLLIGAAVLTHIAYRSHIQQQTAEEKLRLLISATNDEKTPLSLDDLRAAVATLVQSRQRQYDTNTRAMQRIQKPDIQGNDEVLMERILQSINRHLDDSDYTVEQLCEEAAISRAHLHRKMKEMTGMPVTEFIRNIRLEQASRLLRERKLTVSQVAYSVGFSNVSYFSTVFRKQFGVSPTAYIDGSETDET